MSLLAHLVVFSLWVSSNPKLPPEHGLRVVRVRITPPPGPPAPSARKNDRSTRTATEPAPVSKPEEPAAIDRPRTRGKTDWHAQAKDVVRALQEPEHSRFAPPPVSHDGFRPPDPLPPRIPALEPSFRPLPQPVETCASKKEIWLGVRKINVTVLHACQEKFDDLPELPSRDAREP